MKRIQYKNFNTNKNLYFNFTKRFLFEKNFILYKKLGKKIKNLYFKTKSKKNQVSKFYMKKLNYYNFIKNSKKRRKYIKKQINKRLFSFFRKPLNSFFSLLAIQKFGLNRLRIKFFNYTYVKYFINSYLPIINNNNFKTYVNNFPFLSERTFLFRKANLYNSVSYLQNILTFNKKPLLKRLFTLKSNFNKNQTRQSQIQRKKIKLLP